MSSGRNTLRRTEQKLLYTTTTLATVGYTYASTGDRFDADASRVTELTLSSEVLASDDDRGMATVTGFDFPEPDLHHRAPRPTPTSLSALYPAPTSPLRASVVNAFLQRQ